MIVLLTDFGLGEYVGVMKGVILGVDPEARIVDLCHDVGPQNLVEASWLLSQNFAYFPAGSTFCCVVDPGVGTHRRAVAVETRDYRFVAPDNGLLWEALRRQELRAIRNIPIPEHASATFHGRDVFAVAAAQVDLGQFESIGPLIESLTPFVIGLSDRQGTVVRIDRFGNVVTNLDPLDQSLYMVQAGPHELELPYFDTYEEAFPKAPFLITGSYNTLEISVKNGNANDLLDLSPGQSVTIA